MRERPILFSAPMVRAILAGQKTQTRRVVKWRGVQPGLNLGFSGLSVERSGSNFVLTSPTRSSHEYRSVPQPCPYGVPGDRLWVKETWSTHACFDDVRPSDITTRSIHYRADGEIQTGKTRVSIHMPRWASRITLEITDGRVERLQAVSEADARAEGIVSTHDGYGLPDGSHYHAGDPRIAYWSLWDSINGAGSTQANPWVWVVEFKRITT